MNNVMRPNTAATASTIREDFKKGLHYKVNAY